MTLSDLTFTGRELEQIHAIVHQVLASNGVISDIRTGELATLIAKKTVMARDRQLTRKNTSDEEFDNLVWKVTHKEDLIL